MNLPFIKFLEALVACKKFSVHEMYSKIIDTKLEFTDSITIEALEKFRVEMYQRYHEQFADPHALPDLEWLRELEVEKMVAYFLQLEIPSGTAGIQGAFEIANDTHMYQLISSMAIAKVNQEDIELIINGRYNIHYTMEDITEFLHYFFNVNSWTLTEKKNYAKRTQNKKLKEFYTIALDGDKDYLIWKLGIAPDKSFDEMLKDMATDSYYCFKEALGTKNTEDAQKWAATMTRLKSRIDENQKDSDTKRSLFEEVTFVLTNKPVSSNGDETPTKMEIPKVTELRPSTPVGTFKELKESEVDEDE